MTRIVAAIAALFLVTGCVQTTKPDAPGDVQSACYQNFVVEGTPGISNVNYRSWREFPGLADQQRALNNLRSAMMAEGFSNIGVDASAGALTAVQAHSIPSRAPTLRVSARKVGAGVRVDAIFMILQGQTSDSTIVRRNLCRIVDAANL